MLWVCAGEWCPAQEVLGPDFFLIFVFIGPLYTEDTEIIFVLGAGIQLGPLHHAWHSVSFLAGLLLI